MAVVESAPDASINTFIGAWLSEMAYTEADLPVDTQVAIVAMKVIAPKVLDKDPALLESIENRNVVGHLLGRPYNTRELVNLNDFYNQWAPLIRDWCKTS